MLVEHLDIILLLIMVGAVGGFLSGMLGIGSGVVFVPALHFVFEKMGVAPQHLMQATVATSLAIIASAVATAAWKRHKRGDVDWETFRCWVPFLVCGVVCGTLLASSVDGQILEKIFAVITSAMALHIVFGRETSSESPKPWFTLPWQRTGVTLVGGLAAMTGLGGGVMMIPMMTMRGLHLQRAVGTGSLLSLFVAIPGAITYIVTGWPVRAELAPYSLGYINIPAALLVAGCAMAAAHGGVAAAYALDKKIMRRIFAGVLIAVSLKMFW